MKPKSQTIDQGDLYRSRLDQILDSKHALFQLADAIDWSVFEQEFGRLYVEKVGRPARPIRLLVGLHYLKHAFNVSDEAVVMRFVENPYWQYFCGFEYFQHRFPLDPTTLVKWRKRIGSKGMEKLLTETLQTAKRRGDLTEQHLERVNIDTTVQEKAIAYPTDARLYHAGASCQDARNFPAAELPEAGQTSLDHERPLQPCPADEAGQARAEKTQDLPGPGGSRHSPALPAARSPTGGVVAQRPAGAAATAP